MWLYERRGRCSWSWFFVWLNVLSPVHSSHKKVKNLSTTPATDAGWREQASCWCSSSVLSHDPFPARKIEFLITKVNTYFSATLTVSGHHVEQNNESKILRWNKSTLKQTGFLKETGTAVIAVPNLAAETGVSTVHYRRSPASSCY